MAAKEDQLLSVIVPAYRQGATIYQDLKNIENVLKSIRYDYEMIVVVDGRYDNSDQTYEEAKKVTSERVRVYGYSQNRGKGYAVRYGMARSRGEVVAFIDSGMEISPNSLSMALEHLEWYKADVIIGSKRHPASRVDYSRSRRITSFGYQMLGWLLFGLKVRDTQVGMKIFRRQVLEDVLPRLLVKRYAFDIEMLSVAYNLGYKRIYESPVELSYKFDSLTTAANMRVIYRMLWDTAAVFYRLKILRYYSDRNKHRWEADPDLSLYGENINP